MLQAVIQRRVSIYVVTITALLCVIIALRGAYATVAANLLIGWLDFIRSVLPSIRIYWPSIITGIVCLVVVLFGVHFTGSWFTRARQAAEPSLVVPAWRFRWSLAMVALVVLLFAAGIAMVALLHQATWLTNEIANQKAFGGSYGGRRR